MTLISALGSKPLQDFLEALNNVSAELITVKDLLRAASAVIPDRAAAKALIRQLINCSILCRQRDISVDDVIRRLSAGIRDASTREKWDLLTADFSRLLLSTPITLTAKASDLSFDYANLLDSTRVITDIRPVYDDAHTRILGGVISHVLRVVYISDYGQHSLSIAMDERDLRRLHGACDEAMKKMDVARRFLASQKLPAITPGEEMDAFGDP